MIYQWIVYAGILIFVMFVLLQLKLTLTLTHTFLVLTDGDQVSSVSQSIDSQSCGDIPEAKASQRVQYACTSIYHIHIYAHTHTYTHTLSTDWHPSELQSDSLGRSKGMKKPHTDMSKAPYHTIQPDASIYSTAVEWFSRIVRLRLWEWLITHWFDW